MQIRARIGMAPVLIGAVVASLLVGFGAGALAIPALYPSQASLNYNPTPSTKEFVVFSNVAEFNDTEIGIPHDQFTPSTLIVNKGDTVLIHFYNTEDEPENHNFLLTAYGVSVDLAQGEHQDITFVADQAGVFSFYCSYHQPTMNGQLIVLPTSG